MTKDEKQSCMTGKLYTRVKMICKDEASMNSEDFIVLRDYCILNILLRNSHRPGVIANLTVGEFDAMTAESLDGQEKFVIPVKRHKTMASSGPARIVISRNFLGILNHYRNLRERILSQFSKNSKFFFVNQVGDAMTSDTISKATKSAARKEGLNSEKFVPKLIRKKATNNTMENNPNSIDQVSTMMCHSKDTALKHYNKNDKMKACLIAEALLNKGYDEDENNENDVLDQSKQEQSSTPKEIISASHDNCMEEFIPEDEYPHETSNYEFETNFTKRPARHVRKLFVEEVTENYDDNNDISDDDNDKSFICPESSSEENTDSEELSVEKSRYDCIIDRTPAKVLR